MPISTLTKIAGELGHCAAELKNEIDKIATTTPFLRALFDDYQKIMAVPAAQQDLPDLFAQGVTFHVLDLSLRNPQDLAQELQHLETSYFLDALVKELHQIHVLDSLLNYLEQISLRDVLKEPEQALMHFYPAFISTYQQARASSGSYFTPESVASFIVRSVDSLLRTNFDLADGLASTHKKTGKALVKLLDPAASVGTYLLHAIDQVERTVKAQEKDWNAYVRDQLLPNIYGFEIYLPTYAFARICLTLKLLQSGYTFAGDEQLPIVHTDALAEPDTDAATPAHTIFASETARATQVKRDKGVAVIVGTPPFATSTRRRPTYEVPNGTLKLPLQDTYVQFLRLAHDYIQDAGYGIIAVITNNFYLSSPGFVRMREEWLKFFSRMYILNLQGNRRTGEVSPSGERDENIAGIQVGLAITLLIRERNPNDSALARVFYAEQWGTSHTKRTFLLENDVSTVEWQELKPFEPLFLFNAVSAPSHVNLESNGLHSLQRGIESYHTFQRGYDYWLLKESVMFLNHGIELLMKELLARQSEYLIFEDLSETATKQIKATREGKSVFDAEGPPKTVTFDEAIRRVAAFINPPELTDELQRNLRMLNKLRNKIEHYEVLLDGQTVGQLIDAIQQPLHDLLASRGIDANFLLGD
jgi:hypothetical protein